jgi:polysaccharide chain length determinant protein (PEP-CTERM system associated)
MQKELTVEDYVSILRRRWIWIAAMTILGGVLGLAATHFVPKRFTSQTLVLVSQPQVPGDYVKPVVSETSARLAAMQEQILSRARLEPVIRQLGLYQNEINQVPIDDLVVRLRKAITVTPIQPMAETRSNGLPGFTVSVNFTDGRLAQQICSTITSLFLEESSQNRQTQAEQTTQFLANQLDEAKAKLDSQDARLAAFQRRNMGELPEESQTNLNLLNGLASQLDATTQELGRVQQDKAFATSLLTQQLGEWKSAQQAVNEGKNPEAPEASALRLTAMQSQLDAMRARYTDDHPDVIRMKNDIAAFKARMAETEKEAAQPPKETAPAPEKPARTLSEPSQIQVLRAQIRHDDEAIREATARQARIQEQIRMYQGRLQSSPAVAQENKQLTRDYQSALEFYNDLLKKRSQSAMATDLERRQQGEQFTIQDAANLPDSPSFPNRSYFTLGGLGAGLALSLGITLLLELQDTSLRSEKDVESLLHVPVLAAVPSFRPLGAKPTTDPPLPLGLPN